MFCNQKRFLLDVKRTFDLLKTLFCVQLSLLLCFKNRKTFSRLYNFFRIAFDLYKVNEFLIYLELG